MAKAALIAAREPPPRLHDIDKLGRRVQKHFPALGGAFEALGGITRWYVSARYPDSGDRPHRRLPTYAMSSRASATFAVGSPISATARVGAEQ